MIDPTLRRLRIAQEARDRDTSAILLDVVLGYGSSPDPGGALQGAIREAVSGQGKSVMAHVCGSETDPQSYKGQSSGLADAGAVLFPSNALLSVAAALVVGGDATATRLRSKWRDLLG